MFESVENAVASWFGGGSTDTAGAPPSGPAAASENPLATGTPGPAAATALFGGLFGGTDESIGTAAKEAREAMQVDAAKEKLKGKFNVSDAPGGGPNDLTPEEFEKMAKLYNDIDRGKTDIQLDASAAGKDQEKAAAMKGLAMEDMAKMMQTPSGRAMLEGLASNPSNEKDAEGNPIHRKTTVKLSDNKFDENDCDEKGMAAARAAGDNDTANAINKKSTTPGVGTDAEIHYRPGESKTLPGADVGATGDTTLFHEMAHAYHMTHGTKVDPKQTVGDDAVTPSDRGTTEEEYATVGLGKHANDPLTENQYRYEREMLGEDSERRNQYH